jgi:RNA polymerase primary sigma factor
MWETRTYIHRAMLRLQQQLGRTPTRSEIALALGISIQKLDDIFLTFLESPSLNDSIDHEDEEDGASIGHFIPDQALPSPDAILEQEQMRHVARQLLTILSPKEQQVITMRFGLDDTPPRTLERIGKLLSLTRERIRQIESAAIRKLARHARRTNLDISLGFPIMHPFSSTPLASKINKEA